MKALATSRADIEIFGKEEEKEDIVPVEFELTDHECKFSIKKTDFIYRLIKESKVFAINVLFPQNEKAEDICQINEGMFSDKFKLSHLEKIECTAIDCPGIKKSEIFECQAIKEEQKGDIVEIFGTILTTKQAWTSFKCNIIFRK